MNTLKSNNQAASHRLNKLKRLLPESQAEAFFLHTLPSLRYFSGFTGDSGFLLVEADEVTFFTDGRYTTQAASELPGGISLVQIDSFIQLSSNLAERKITLLGVEEQSFSIFRNQELKKRIPHLQTLFCQQQISTPRLCKDKEELALIKQAIAIAEEAYQQTITLIKPGITEHDIALELEYQMKRRGAEGTAFDLIVASGYRSALPHGVASEKPIAPGDMITIDFGACYQGYHSDQTCTVFLGEPTIKHKKAYQAVFLAQQAGIKAARPEISAKELDHIVRKMLEQAGYGEYFSHGTGHGVGLEIHEAPSISSRSTDTLAANMVFTIEPGCYFPHQWGIRLEDMIYLTDQGSQVLTTLDKQLESAIIE
ncbi:MAG: aminopeptidase P family protein [Deltaproteobacteria bacterium]|nr:aminopeptidase P family protein [Deltaproteobacteria bacterium]